MRSALLLLLAACTTDSATESAQPSDSILLTDANNATLDVQLVLGHVDVEPTDAMVLDWGSLTEDLGRGSLAPATINTASLYWFSELSEADLLAAILDNSLSQASTSGQAGVMFNHGETSVRLDQLMALTGPEHATEFFKDTQGCWLLALSDAQAARWATFVTPVADDADLRADLSQAGSSLTVSATLSEPVVLPAGKPATVDWSGLAHDARGAAWRPENARELDVSRFGGSPESVAADLLRARDDINGWYRLDVYGDSVADLASASDGSGTFSGIQPGETWGLSILCDTCFLPLPVFATQLVAE